MISVFNIFYHRGQRVNTENPEPNSIIMKYILFLIFAGILAFVGCQSKKETSVEHQHHTASADQPAVDTVKKSIPKEEHAMIGDAHITILYYAPAVRGRVIWGGLIPYDEVWVTGAHKATSFEINKDFSVGDKKVPAGKYAFFTIPGKTTWTFIVNKTWDQHLADNYSATDDLARIEVTPEMTTEVQERLSYNVVTKSDKEASVIIAWEKIKLTIPLMID